VKQEFFCICKSGSIPILDSRKQRDHLMVLELTTGS